MALKDRREYEVLLKHALYDIATVIRLYPRGMSIEWMLEHLVRREALNLRYTYPPSDPPVQRAAKDKVIIKR